MSCEGTELMEAYSVLLRKLLLKSSNGQKRVLQLKKVHWTKGMIFLLILLIELKFPITDGLSRLKAVSVEGTKRRRSSLRFLPLIACITMTYIRYFTGSCGDCVPFFSKELSIPASSSCLFLSVPMPIIPSDYQFQLAFVPAHTKKPILRNLLFWLSKVASSIHSTQPVVLYLRLTMLAGCCSCLLVLYAEYSSSDYFRTEPASLPEPKSMNMK